MNMLKPRHVPNLYSVEVEQELLGAILRTPPDYWRVADMVTDAEFFDPLHGRIWKTIGRMMLRDRQVSPSSVVAAMTTDEGLAEVGSEYLKNLALSVSAGARVADAANVIADFARRRRIIEAATQAVDEAYDDEAEPDQIADRAAEMLYLAAHSNEPGRGPEPLLAPVERAITIAENAVNNPRSSRILTGMPSVDRALGGLFPRDLTTLGAAPSQGKSGLGAQLGLSAARNGYRVLVFSIEMASEEWAMRYVAQEANVPADRIIEGRITTPEFERIARAREAFLDITYRLDGTKDISAAQIRARCMAEKRRGGIDLFVVDHLKHVRPADRRATFTEQMDQITKDLKATAADIGSACLLVSHLNREFWSRNNHRPVISDLYGSSAIEQNSDHIWFLHREEYYLERNIPPESDVKTYTEWLGASERAKGKAEIFSVKRRGGKVGSAMVRFDGPMVRFVDPENEAAEDQGAML